MWHSLRTILYHGTASEIQQVDVRLGRERKDFGKGFYMAVSKSQAIGMMHKKYREVVRRSKGKLDSAYSEKLYEIVLDIQQALCEKGTREAGYYSQCNHFWSEKCPCKTGKKIKCRDCSSQSWKKLDMAVLKKHLEGKAADASDVIGIYPLLPDDTCRFLVFDFDNHEKDANKGETQNADERWREEVEALREICRQNRIDALTERSRSGRGAHVWIFFQSAVEAFLARKFGFALLEKGAESVNLKSFTYYDCMLPAQNHVPDGGKSGRPGLGNLIALPLQGLALKLEGLA